MSLTPLT